MLLGSLLHGGTLESAKKLPLPYPRLLESVKHSACLTMMWLIFSLGGDSQWHFKKSVEGPRNPVYEGCY